jgi:acetoin:2,6-dichlorophenolindophenol oxidoreductase subunit beta
MKTMNFSDAIDDALALEMAQDERVILLGEDVEMIHRGLFVRFGSQRVRNTPISEAAFVGAAVAASMAGLRPVVEVMLVDFIAVAFDALLNHAAKLETFSGGHWQAPLVIRTTCGAGYGDGGQHGQSLWGLPAHIPGLSVVVPSNPADAGGLMLSALHAGSPVIFMEHKLLSEVWLEFLGAGGRKTVSFDVPAAGARGPVPQPWVPVPLGKAAIRRAGNDLSIISLGVGVHRALEAAGQLSSHGIQAAVLDLRTVAPLDRNAICEFAARSQRMLVVDEDYQVCGLSGELAATVLEAGIPLRYARVCTETTIPYARPAEEQTLPNVARIIAAAMKLMA